MTRLTRRQKQQFIFAGVVLCVGLASVVFFLTFYLPARLSAIRREASINDLRAEIVESSARLEQLQLVRNRISSVSGDRSGFRANRLIPRNEGFGAVLPGLERLAAVAGVSRNRVQYRIETDQFGISAVRINIPVRGDYAAVKRFIRELESGDTFFILDSIRMNRVESDGSSALDLSLNLTTFFTHDG